jgi:hypothetical protein
MDNEVEEAIRRSLAEAQEQEQQSLSAKIVASATLDPSTNLREMYRMKQELRAHSGKQAPDFSSSSSAKFFSPPSSSSSSKNNNSSTFYNSSGTGKGGASSSGAAAPATPSAPALDDPGLKDPAVQQFMERRMIKQASQKESAVKAALVAEAEKLNIDGGKHRFVSWY